MLIWTRIIFQNQNGLRKYSFYRFLFKLNLASPLKSEQNRNPIKVGPE